MSVTLHEAYTCQAIGRITSSIAKTTVSCRYHAGHVELSEPLGKGANCFPADQGNTPTEEALV